MQQPELFGVAMKPVAENMSAYCSVKAVDAFEDLVTNLDTRYIVVSYNNTYNSKSSSSENKIQLEDIERILNKLGPTKVFEHSHQFFNAGKTEFDDHKELVPMQAGDVPVTYADTTALERDFRFKPSTNTSKAF